ncbi:MAG: metalloregulator ArsR/SmtB family transcription factor [Sphingomonadaceae bacterium]|nr:winged helix-turn-helix transcriptional regulator [Sphingomonadaceae bacterium]
MNSLSSLDHAFHALGDGTRRAIIRFLESEGELPAGEIAGRFASAMPTISKHLKVLETAGLVAARREGRNRYYALVPGGLAPARSWMERHSKLWNHSLDQLGDYLDEQGS